MLKVKFKKIETNHNRIRDNEILGKCTHIPEEGHQFVMWGEGRDLPGSTRQVNTSPVKAVKWFEDTRTFVLWTESGSTYEVEVLDPRDPFEYKRWSPND